MLRRDASKIENYFEVFLIVSLLATFIYMIKGFLMPIFLAATLVFLFYKPYLKLARKTKNKTISALFLMFIIVTLIFVPVYIVSATLVTQTYDFIGNNGGVSKAISWDSCKFSFCENLKNNVKYFDFKLENTVERFGSFLINSVTKIFSSISNFIVNLAIFLLAFFYLLIDGDKFIKHLRRMIPMKEEYKNALFVRFKEVSQAVFLDSILVAVMQGFLLGVGFRIVGIENPVFWGTITAFFALIPIVGTAVVWIPATLILIISGEYVSASILFFYSLIVVGLSDNFIRMFDLNRKIKIHPFLILISVIGGMNVFGFFGLFLGPIIVSLIAAVFQLYRLEFD